MTRKAFGKGASAWSKCDGNIGFGGMGLPLAEAYDEGIDDEEFASALSHCLHPPLIDIGVRFSPIKAGRKLLSFSMLEPDRTQEVAMFQDRLGFDLNFGDLLFFYVPVIRVPVSGETVAAGHPKELLSYMVRHDIRVSSLQTLRLGEVWVPAQLRRYNIPKCHGPVFETQLNRFCRRFPGLVPVLSSRLEWIGSGPSRRTDAQVANRTASDLLDIDLDLRAGSLVPKHFIRNAIEIASQHGVVREDELVEFELVDFVGEFLQQVPRPFRGDPMGLEGAAWSCMVDTVLNAPCFWNATKAELNELTSGSLGQGAANNPAVHHVLATAFRLGAF